MRFFYRQVTFATSSVFEALNFIIENCEDFRDSNGHGRVNVLRQLNLYTRNPRGHFSSRT